MSRGDSARRPIARVAAAESDVMSIARSSTGVNDLSRFHAAVRRISARTVFRATKNATPRAQRVASSSSEASTSSIRNHMTSIVLLTTSSRSESAISNRPTKARTSARSRARSASDDFKSRPLPVNRQPRRAQPIRSSVRLKPQRNHRSANPNLKQYSEDLRFVASTRSLAHRADRTRMCFSFLSCDLLRKSWSDLVRA